MCQRLVAIAMLVLLIGCSYRVETDLGKVRVGMSEQEVIAELGRASLTRQQGSVRVLTYQNYSRWLTDLSDQQGANRWAKDDLYVRLINGRVESFGKMGDFNSTNNPSLDLNVTTRSR